MSKKKKIDNKHLFHAICHLNVVPVWFAPSDDAIMVSQMLFGETCSILEKKNKHWFKIQTTVCDIIGWAHAIQLSLIEQPTFEKLSQNPATALEGTRKMAAALEQMLTQAEALVNRRQVDFVNLANARTTGRAVVALNIKILLVFSRTNQTVF